MFLHDTEVDILVNNKPVRKYSHSGRTYIEAKHWTEYTIRIRNTSSFRRLAVVTVDGLNVINGEAGGKTQAGYVINGYSSFEVKGYRASHDVVHPFKFNRKEASYAAKSDVTDGDTSNCGVIGVEIYEEKYTPVTTIINWPTKTETPWCPPLSPLRPTYTVRSTLYDRLDTNTVCTSSSVGTDTCSSLSNSSMLRECCNCSASNPPKFDMGTEFSREEVEDKVRDVEFEIGERLVAVSIYYASRIALESMGISLKKDNQIAFPNPFPAKFCRPPKR